MPTLDVQMASGGEGGGEDAATAVLVAWFDTHIIDPYPSTSTKSKLAKQTGLTYVQVSAWFVARRDKAEATARIVGQKRKRPDEPWHPSRTGTGSTILSRAQGEWLAAWRARHPDVLRPTNELLANLAERTRATIRQIKVSFANARARLAKKRKAIASPPQQQIPTIHLLPSPSPPQLLAQPPPLPPPATTTAIVVERNEELLSIPSTLVIDLAHHFMPLEPLFGM
jgi:hypothetical protein